MTSSVEAIAAEILAMPPAERFETVALMLRQARPDIQRIAWTIAERTVKEHGAKYALAELDRAAAALRGGL